MAPTPGGPGGGQHNIRPGDAHRHRIVNIQHVTRFNTGGHVMRMTVVSYFVGPYGPFTVELAEGQDSAAEIQAAIQMQVAKIQALEMGT